MSRVRDDSPVFAVDLGGSKLLAALVLGGNVIDRERVSTPRDSGPDTWIEQIADRARTWSGRFDRIGVAVTGVVRDGVWSALNPDTLAIPAGFQLAERLRDAFGERVEIANDAQAAAWGEYRFGAGAGWDIVFLTISTGIGGGVVFGGQLLHGHSGLCGSFGQMVDRHGDTIEQRISGRWIAAEAMRRGHPCDAKEVFRFAAEGADWAGEIIATSARRACQLCRNIQFALDPQLIVIGGGVGLAQGYIGRIEAHLAELPQTGRPSLVPAALGEEAGVIGIAALTTQTMDH